jgi:hypothetical protein
MSKLSFGKAKPVEPKEADTDNAPEADEVTPQQVETEPERQARCNRENAEAATVNGGA